MSKLDEITDLVHKEFKRPDQFKPVVKEARTLLANDLRLETNHVAALFSALDDFKKLSGKKDPEKWLYLATGMDRNRTEICKTIWSDGEHLYATDGHRLHRIKQQRPPGVYSLITGGLLDVRYPDVMQLIPSPSGDPIVGTFESLASEIVERHADVQDVRALPGAHASGAYLKEAMQGFECEIWIKDDLSPIQIEHKFGMAIVMPIRR